MTEKDIKDYKILAETFTLTAFFRSLVFYPYSKEIIRFLLKTSHLSLDDLSKRWDSFDKIFGEEHGKKISALSFSSIIEARGKLIDSIFDKIDKENTIILELGAGFSPRGLNFVNNKGLSPGLYIETDLNKTIILKQSLYNSLQKQNLQVPTTKKFNVSQKKDWTDIYNLIKIMKIEKPCIKSVKIMCEGLLLYLNKKQQKDFFEELSIFSGLLKNEGISVSFLTIDMPTHENFTNWLLHEGFDFKSHIDVMKKVDNSILESLHNTEEDFLMENSLKNINKYYYTDDIINSMFTYKLDKYKDVPKIFEKVTQFLKQKTLFAWENFID